MADIEDGALSWRAGWVGPWGLKPGGQGSVERHVKQDRNGRIVDRVVIKDTRLPKDPLLWLNGDKGETGVPFGVHALYELRSLIGSESVIEIRNWRPNRQERTYRQFLEYAPHGDLEDLIRSGIYQVEGGSDYGDENSSEDGSPRFIPESFIWYCIDNLTLAGTLMERGELDEYGMRPWNVILHRDMKPHNIFLGGRSSRFPGYPGPKLGDWDISVELREDLQGNLRRTQGTHGFIPYELQEVEGGEPESRTNVWGLGIIAWSLVTCNYEGYDPMDSGEVSAPMNVSATTHYSDELLNLIDRCTRSKPEDRPSFSEIRRIVDRHTTGGAEERAMNLRNCGANDDRWKALEAEFPDNVLNDKFALGSALAPDEQGHVYGVPIPRPPRSDDQPDSLGGETGVEIGQIEEDDEEDEEEEDEDEKIEDDEIEDDEIDEDELDEDEDDD